MLPLELQQRKRELQKALNELSGSSDVVIASQRQIETGDVVAEFKASVRVQPTSLRFLVWEQFRDIDAEPRLFAFKYQLTEAADVQSLSPMFRYECHPGVNDCEAGIEKAVGGVPQN